MNEPINQRTDNRSTNQIGGQLGFERSATGLNGPAYCMNMIKTTKPPGCGNKRTSTGASQAGDNIFYFLKAHEKKKKTDSTSVPSPKRLRLCPLCLRHAVPCLCCGGLCCCCYVLCGCCFGVLYVVVLCFVAVLLCCAVPAILCCVCAVLCCAIYVNVPMIEGARRKGFPFRARWPLSSGLRGKSMCSTAALSAGCLIRCCLYYFMRAQCVRTKYILRSMGKMG